MAESFDGYHKWLGIPPSEQPPHHYRLLGLSIYESDPDVIEIAADQRMALLRSFHAGPHSDLTQRLLNEVAAARLTLLKPDRRQSYNEMLRRRLEKAQPREEQTTQPAKPAPAPAAEEPSKSLTRYYEQLRQHVGEEPPRRSANDDLLETLVPVESPPKDELDLIKPVRPIKPAPVSIPVAASPKVEAIALTAAKPVISRAHDLGPAPKVEAVVSTAAKPVVARDHDLGPAPKPANKPGAMPAPRAQPDRSITLPPRSAAWDQAIEEAVATESGLSRPRQHRLKVSGRFVQIVVGVLVIAGLLYGGIKGFTLWQVREARRTAVAMHDVRRPLSPPDDSPEVAASDAHPAHTEPVEPAHAAPAVSQPVPSEPNDPGLKDAKSVAGGFGMPSTQATSSSAATSPSSSGEPQPRPIVRTPIPAGEERRKSSEAVSDEVKIESRRVATASGKAELAHKLADKANETTDDPAKRYALANRALELAVKLCDVRLASDLVGGLSTYYEQDSWATGQDAPTIERIGTEPRDSRNHRRGSSQPRRTSAGRRSLRQRIGLGDNEHEHGDEAWQHYSSRSSPRGGRSAQADPTLAQLDRGRKISINCESSRRRREPGHGRVQESHEARLAGGLS